MSFRRERILRPYSERKFAMKLLVIGLGSMGRRRIGLLLNHFDGITVCGADIREERRAQAQALFGIPVYADASTAAEREKPYAALICTPPAGHSAVILDCVKKGLHIFSEINLLSDRYEEILQAAKEHRVKLFLSSTLLYRGEIEKIRDCVLKQPERVNYRYHVGQYLPDWHPWENYRDFFVSDPRTSACREIFAIELPWILHTFGKIRRVTVFKDHLSSLELGYPDNYFVVLEHRNGNKGIWIVDVVSRKAERNLLVYSEKLHLTWDGTPDSLYQYNIEEKRTEKIETCSSVLRDEKYAETITENAYLKELRVFVDKITGGKNRERYTFEEDRKTLRLIDRIEGTGP
ncbi:Gfo/Idh/MocA family protein [Caproiciproducens sp. CPB-2]|uniref:Gfo/Idh/MocA family protein n=1 Tax=Caproiciproducens sp. CPB-2 TaxID=3030017 RepID=UPI0023DCABC3|nr:Gfo/Idh/MocA family oxidoreductase [Caproiciproducens sp. CPB-2]MDF1494772.1 Gfo/Idh/MocA family oxidoreductase [Caproiciproducens sp. CPB-2]